MTSAELWDGWYAEHGRRVASTRHWRSEQIFLDSGRADADAAIRRFDLPTTGHCHEVGAGLGRMTSRLVEIYPSVSVNDVSIEALRTLMERLPAVDAKLGGAEALDAMPSKSCSSIISVAVMQHVSDCQEVIEYIASVSRILASGGRAAIQVAAESQRRRAHDTVIDLTRNAARIVGAQALPSGNAWRGCRPTDALMARTAATSGSSLSVVHDGLWDWVLIQRS